MKVRLPRPEELSTYYQGYLKYVQTDDLLDALLQQRKSSRDFLAGIGTDKEKYRYAEGKWSVREVAGHVCDAERIMAYRALCIARKDPSPLPGFEENDYTLQSNYDALPLNDIAEHLDAVRASNILLFRSFSPGMYDHTGIANGEPVSVRALLFFTIGHQAHHLRIIKERYLDRP